MIVLVVSSTLTLIDAPRIGENLPTPWVGAWERINLGVFLLRAVVRKHDA